MSKLGLDFELPIGFKAGGQHTREVSLLTSNSIAEEVFTKKLAQEPFTWIANVISVATEKIGSVYIAQQVREDYLKTHKVNIPNIVKQIPLSDANSMLLEIHRRVWKSEMKSMEAMCRFCSKNIEIDVDLNKIELSEAQKELLEGNPEFDAITCDLEDFTLAGLMRASKNENIVALAETKWNRMVFRIPTLGDAIKNQDNFDKNIQLWRNIGADCLVSIQRIELDADERETVAQELEGSYLKLLGNKFYKELEVENLRRIRHSLREELPVLPFAYMDDCACDMAKKIPHAVDSTGFFSE